MTHTTVVGIPLQITSVVPTSKERMQSIVLKTLIQE